MHCGGASPGSFRYGAHRTDYFRFRIWKERFMKTFERLTRKWDRQPVRYLIVDDSVFARKSLAKMIESYGGQVIGEAGDGCTAITEYARTKPDIVLMDITMPQMEGIEAVDRIVHE